MNVLKKSMLLSGCVAALTLGAANHAMAQRDPSQFRQDRLDRTREQLEIKDDKEWSAIEPLVGKVIDAQRDLMMQRMGAFGGGRGMRRRGGEGSTNNATAGTEEQRPRRGGFGEPSAAVTALRDAIAANAPTSELKTKLAAVRAEAKEKEDALTAAESDLRAVLSTRQEAIAVANGILR